MCICLVILIFKFSFEADTWPFMSLEFWQIHIVKYMELFILSSQRDQLSGSNEKEMFIWDQFLFCILCNWSLAIIVLCVCVCVCVCECVCVSIQADGHSCHSPAICKNELME